MPSPTQLTWKIRDNRDAKRLKNRQKDVRRSISKQVAKNKAVLDKLEASLKS
jgi:hypothetical protein